jgi:hypothetical protein
MNENHLVLHYIYNYYVLFTYIEICATRIDFLGTNTTYIMTGRRQATKARIDPFAFELGSPWTQK